MERNPKINTVIQRSIKGVSSLVAPIKEGLKRLDNKTAIVLAPALLVLANLPEKVLSDIGSFTLGGAAGEIIGKKLVLNNMARDLLVLFGAFAGIAAMATLKQNPNFITYLLSAGSGISLGISHGTRHY